MSRWIAAFVAALMASSPLTAARADTQAAASFPEVNEPDSTPRSHFWSYVCIGAGVALVGGSFLFKSEADDRYAEYLAATDPDQVANLYDQTVMLDRLSTASLISGEVLVAGGLYLRFLHNPSPSRVQLSLAPGRCALALRF